MDFAIERKSLNHFHPVLRECHNLTKVLNESLTVAIVGGHLWATDRLLAEEADPNWREWLVPNAKSKKYVGLTALQAAAKGGYLELVNKLVMATADVNAHAGRNSG